MKATDVIEQIKAKHRLPSDYAVAKLLEISTTTISHYRNRGSNMDVATAFKAAELLEVDPALLIAEMELKRAKTSTARETLSRYIKSASALILVVFLVGGIAYPRQGAAVTVYTLCEALSVLAVMAVAAYFTLCRLAHTGRHGMVSLISSQ